MADKMKSQAEDPEVIIESALGRTEQFFMQNGRIQK